MSRGEAGSFWRRARRILLVFLFCEREAERQEKVVLDLERVEELRLPDGLELVIERRPLNELERELCAEIDVGQGERRRLVRASWVDRRDLRGRERVVRERHHHLYP